MSVFSSIVSRNLIVSPLDWGLGHAARIVPVIRELEKSNKVTVVSGPCAYNFLKAELPDADIVMIDDWQIRYPRRRINFFTLLKWIPVVLRNSIHEHRFVKKIIRERNISTVISDNRYGLLFRGLECYIVTHQVCPKMPEGFRFLERISNFAFKRYLSKFHKVLIPDLEEGFSLTGSLASDCQLDTQKFVRIGILSRFRGQSPSDKPKYDYLVLISGQEDQRTVFENELLEKVRHSDKKILFVRGVNEHYPILDNTPNIRFHNMLTGNELYDAFVSSETIICRAGYSTICDIVALGKRAIIVPTPGQTEQEYLAVRLNGHYNIKSFNDCDFQL